MSGNYILKYGGHSSPRTKRSAPNNISAATRRCRVNGSLYMATESISESAKDKMFHINMIQPQDSRRKVAKAMKLVTAYDKNAIQKSTVAIPLAALNRVSANVATATHANTRIREIAIALYLSHRFSLSAPARSVMDSLNNSWSLNCL